MENHKKKKEHLIHFLKEEWVLDSPILTEAFRYIDRKDFLREENTNLAYENTPLSIGYGQTISQPYTVAFMLELLDVHVGNKVLDIGSGSGWTTALLTHLAGERGSVTGIEIIPELVRFGGENLARYHFSNTRILQAKEGELGISSETFDRILVSASADMFPAELLDQLKPDWRLVMPVRDSIFLYKKDREGKVSSSEFPGFVFVPLR